jgi:MFS family permease
MAPGPARLKLLAPFGQRSFRFQWPSDLATSWAFEMETLILGWYILTETGSVVWLSVFAALQLLGTLVSPFFGLAGDRIGHRRVLLGMRATYAALAATLATLALSGLLSVTVVFATTFLYGLVRPSDLGMRNALIGATMPAPLLMGAMAIERSSADTARIAGALTGGALAAWLGVGLAYLGVTAIYLTSLLLLLGASESRPAGGERSPAAIRHELAEGFGHVRHSPPLLAAMGLAFLTNALAYPLTSGLLPHVARDIYGMGQAGLSLLSASFATGALAGSVVLIARGGAMAAGRTMVVAALTWFALLVVFAALRQAWAGMLLLFAIGAVQSFCMVPMAVLILRVASERMRGRVMGVRMLAVYGMSLGLVAAGPLVAWLGFMATAWLYAGLGLACCGWIAARFRAHLWPPGAPANARPG